MLSSIPKWLIPLSLPSNAKNESNEHPRVNKIIFRGLPSLGMPCHRGSGSHLVKGEKYRFLVMDRFGSDLQKIFQTGEAIGDAIPTLW